MASNFVYLVTALFVIVQALPVRSEIFPQCEGIPIDTFIANLDVSCAAYIYCNETNSKSWDCPGGYYFDPEKKGCDLEADVYCPLDDDYANEDGEDVEEEEDEEEEEEEEGEEEGEAEEEDEDNEEAGEDRVTTVAPTVTPTGNETTFNPLVISPIVKDVCPNVDNANEIIMMANNHSCSDYYLCYHGHAIQMHCTDSLHFNTGTGKCDFPEKAHCMLDRPNAITCQPQTTDLFPHPERCNYFYYCIKGFLTIQQCPYYYGWDIERRRCVRMSEAKCYPSSSRKA